MGLLDDLVNAVWEKGFCEKCQPPNKTFIRLDIAKILDKYKVEGT